MKLSSARPVVGFLAVFPLTSPLLAEETLPGPPNGLSERSDQSAAATSSDSGQNDSAPSRWHYGAYLELSYPVDFNFPENHLWRSKVTTPHVNELTLNMALAYVRKDANESSRWGMELAVQGGDQVEAEIPNASFRYGDPHSDADAFSHFSRANVSYLAPIGTGLRLTAGLFNSFIGYESFYAKDNFNYTRSYLPDYSPYFMFGVSAQYQINEAVKSVFYVINRYNFLSAPNHLPSYGTQVSWAASPRITLIQNLYYGPDQSNTDLRYWRFFSDSIIQWKQDNLTIAFVYDIGTERAIPEAGGQRVFWTGSAIYTNWQFANAWALAIRPELYYDPDGTMTGARQFIKAITTTLEYKLPIAATITRFRLEYRYDDSTGPQGGFFKDGEISPGVIGLTQAQHLLIAAVLWTYDSPQQSPQTLSSFLDPCWQVAVMSLAASLGMRPCALLIKSNRTTTTPSCIRRDLPPPLGFLRTYSVRFPLASCCPFLYRLYALQVRFHTVFTLG